MVAGDAARIARTTAAKWAAPPSSRSSRSTEVITTCTSPSVATASATRDGSSLSRARGIPVATLQKAQARVQVSPMIIIVACRCDQHSPMFGQAASSHTVTSRFARISARVSWYTGWFGARTRIQSGLRATGLSGRRAFSGCRCAGPPVRWSTRRRVVDMR